jgi:hypothetical protein
MAKVEKEPPISKQNSKKMLQQTIFIFCEKFAKASKLLHFIIITVRQTKNLLTGGF